MSAWLIWLIAAVVFFVVELLTPSLISIWFALAALIMSLLSFIKLSLEIQLLIFLILSALFLLFFRKIYLGKIKPRIRLKDNLVDKTISSNAIVTQTINNNLNQGQVIVNGVYWKAISQDDTIIEKDTKVIVLEVSETKVIVKKV